MEKSTTTKPSPTTIYSILKKDLTSQFFKIRRDNQWVFTKGPYRGYSLHLLYEKKRVELISLLKEIFYHPDTNILDRENVRDILTGLKNNNDNGTLK